MTSVIVEEGDVLDPGQLMVFKDFGSTIRMAYNPRRLTEGQALTLLRASIPRLSGMHQVSHPAGT
ncbi:hypothetical protein PV350_31250 [Streptomyces sp. PA03-6a]|nr:hypothetical protein [Streptomyces sp. PA03-6a]